MFFSLLPLRLVEKFGDVMGLYWLVFLWLHGIRTHTLINVDYVVLITLKHLYTCWHTPLLACWHFDQSIHINIYEYTAILEHRRERDLGRISTCMAKGTRIRIFEYMKFAI